MAYTPFNTGNPVGTWGSTAPRDLVDNAGILDKWVNDRTLTQWRDRLGVQRLTWNGMEVAFNDAQADRDDQFDVALSDWEQRFNAFLLESGYQFIGDYDGDGPLTITEQNQIFSKDGEYWRPGPDLALPYTTVDSWIIDQPKFVSVGDAVLRSDLAAPDGTDLVTFERGALADAVRVTRILGELSVSLFEFESHIASKPNPNDPNTWLWSPAIAAAIDYVSSNGGGRINLGIGTRLITEPITVKSGVTLFGSGNASVIKGAFPVATNRMITSDAAVLQNDITLRDFKVDRSGPNTEHGIILGGIKGLLIENVTVTGFVTGVTSGAMGISPFNEFAAVQSSDVTVRGCHIITPNNFGIAFGNVNGGCISDCHIYDAWREAIGLEVWELTSVVENVTVTGNTLKMSTRAANHTGGSVGPAILIGGAGYADGGLARNCVVSNNTIFFDNPANEDFYRGIVLIGAPSFACESIVVADNVLINPPAQGIYAGAVGSITQNCAITGNLLVNPNSRNNGYAGITLRNAQGMLVHGNKIVGTLHSYAVSEETGASGNSIIDNAPGTPVNGEFLPLSDISRYRSIAASQFMGGRAMQDAALVPNDGTFTFRNRTNPNRGLYLIVADSGDYAILSVISTAAPTVIAKSVSVAVGATDPGTAAALNIYPASASAISVTNRLGTARTVVAQSLCAT